MTEEKNLVEELAQAAEPWEKWEGRLVLWSMGIGLLFLIVLGVLAHIFILK